MIPEETTKDTTPRPTDAMLRLCVSRPPARGREEGVGSAPWPTRPPSPILRSSVRSPRSSVCRLADHDGCVVVSEKRWRTFTRFVLSQAGGHAEQSLGSGLWVVEEPAASELLREPARHLLARRAISRFLEERNATAGPAGGGPVRIPARPLDKSNGKAPMSAKQRKAEEVVSEWAGVLAVTAEEEAREAAEEAVQVARDAELAGRAVSEQPSSVVESEWVKVSSGAGVVKTAAAPVEGSNPFSALSVASADPDPAASADPNPAASAAKPESPVVPKPPKKRVGQTDDELLDAAIAEKSRALRGGTAPEPASPPSDPEPTRPSGCRRGKRSAGSVRDRRRTTRNRRRERVAEVAAPSAPSAAPVSHPAARSDRPSGALAGRRRNERQLQHGAGRERPVQVFVEHATTAKSVPWFGLLSASVVSGQAQLFPRMGRVRLQLGRGPHFPEESTLRECGVGARSTMRATMLLPGGADDEPHAAGGSSSSEAMRCILTFLLLPP